MFCILSTSTPTAAQTLVGLAQESKSNFRLWFHSSGWAKSLQSQDEPQIRPQEKQRERNAAVRRLQIFPGDLTIDINESVQFAAVAFDNNENPVGGVKVKWASQSSDSRRNIRISPRGEVRALTPGTFTITAEAQNASAQVTVVVSPGAKRNPNETPASTRVVSTRDLPETEIASTQATKSANAEPATRKTGRETVAKVKRAHAAKPKVAAAAVPFLPGDGWDDSNYWSADDPTNTIGNPPAAPQDGGAGSGNFQFTAPIYSAPGRGMDVSLNAVYNSRLWNKAGTQISYDTDRGWPAPGFSLGFGKLLGMGINNGCMLVDADGTRHSYTGTISFFSWGTNGVMHTTDGSMIDYSYWTGTNGIITSAEARLPNGTVIYYGAYSQAGGGVFPTSIVDVNGNAIAITYVNNAGPKIQTITDTLGRVVNFHYNSNSLLTAITAPTVNSGTRTLVRFHYRQLTLNAGFSGLTTFTHNSNPWVVDAIYYPATGTGYWFNDSTSYSSYGMLAKVVEQRNMGFSASSLTDMGTISQGLTTRSETYNYPLTPNYSLTDAPTYTSMDESWTRDGSNTDSATTQYSVNQASTPRSTIVTLPNGTKSKQLAYNAPGQWNDGLVYRDETYVTEGQPLQVSQTTWQQGAYGAPRPTRVEKTNERGQTTATEFSYGSVYNQVTDVRDYGYSGELLRSTRSTYQNSSNYTNNHVFNLPLTVDVYAGDNVTRVARTEYQYDGQTLTDAPGVVMHSEVYNPYGPTYENCYCNEWDHWQIECLQWNCQWTSNYNPATEFRGNVTQITNYANAISLTGAEVETRRYDITGNMVTAGSSCCAQTSFEYTAGTQYAYPVSTTKGSASDGYAQIKTTAVYDFSTGLITGTTDANGRPSSTSYNANTLRPTSTSSPTGARIDYSSDDTALTVTSTTYLSTGEGGGIADQNVKYLNGRGQLRQEKALGAGSVWDFVDTVYNNMGQVVQQTRPYRTGETKQWTTVAYDTLGRTTTVTAPDGSISQSFYNETTRPSVASTAAGETTRLKDPWGRERWSRKDALGRLVEIVEPDPNGSGPVASNGLVTTYAYNTLGHLTQTTQGSQTRSFKYDSLGRLTAQKLAEASATLNDSGSYVGSGSWTDVFVYDTQSNLTSRTDARGVKTVYTYSSDPLNRLQSVSWDTTGFGDTSNPILAAPTVSYQYRTKSSASEAKDVTQVASIATSSVSTESYTYDTEGRIASKTLTLSSRASYPFATNYIYDSLDRVKETHYPAQYGNGSAPRKIVYQTYDVASRLSSVTYGTQSFASNIAYNAGSQTTSINVGTGTNQVVENYGYHAETGLMSSQTATRNGSTLLNLSYDYAGANGKRSGQLVKITNNLDVTRNRSFTYDALGRLKQANGGSFVSPQWTQNYVYDRYGNRTSVSATGVAGGSPVPVDGHASLTYSATSNRITSSGFAYDAAGNQVRALVPGSSTVSQRFQYDAANRLVKVKADDNVSVLATYTYGHTKELLKTEEAGGRIYYVGEGGSPLAEFFESGASTTPVWSRSYVFLGNRLLSTLTPNGSGGETTQYHHPDRLGTKLVTNPGNGTSFEQATLPFGVALGAESTGATNRRFTSYDRSSVTGLDYAINRRYDSAQGRFTQVDPLGMSASNPDNPQTLNLYAYCANDPVNFLDPDGLFFKKLFSGLAKVFKWIGKVVTILTIVSAVVAAAIIFAPASSFVFKAAMWMAFKVLIPLSKIPLIGKAVGMGALGSLASPQWNPAAKGAGLRMSWDGEDEVLKTTINACKNGNKYPYCGAGWWGLVPVVGSAWDAHDSFRSGNWGWGILYTAAAVSDVFLVKSAVTAGGKLLVKGGTALVARRAVAGACFTAGTKISTADGKTPIESVKVGDLVWSRDETSGETALRRVVKTFQQSTELLVVVSVGDDIVETTLDHPFWIVGQGWVEGRNLRAGHVLQSMDGASQPITGIEYIEGHFNVYNFEVEGFHTYFVSERQVFVHNKAMRLTLPSNARTFTNADAAFSHLDTYHKIGRNLASERLHQIKSQWGLGAAENVLFDRTGGVWHPVTRELLGSLTEGGAKRVR